MPGRSNAEWVRALSTDPCDGDALADLLEALRRAALFHIRRRLSGLQEVGADEIDALAEDSAQEASLLILKKLDTFRGEARFLTWAASFSIMIARTALRRRLWQELSLDRVPDGWQEPRATALPGDGWANPQLATQRKAIWDVIQEVVASDLTPRQRQALNLIVVNGVPTEEVEDLLGVTPSALYKMTHDARRKLKAGLLKRGFTTREILDAFAAQA